MSSDKNTLLNNDTIKSNESVEFSNLSKITLEEIQEYKKCKEDIIYFAENYFAISYPKNEIHIPYKLYWYQKEILNGMVNHQYTAYSVARQNGKSVMCCIAALWFALFHPNYRIAILSPKKGMSEDINKILKYACDNLPDFLQFFSSPSKLGSQILKFLNGSYIYTSEITKYIIRGKSLNYIFLDEFAYADEDYSEEIYSSIIPCLSSSKKGKLCLISTPSSKNHIFFKIFETAERGKLNWRAARYPWSVHPHRDEKWETEIKNIIGTEKWETEFELQFSNN